MGVYAEAMVIYGAVFDGEVLDHDTVMGFEDQKNEFVVVRKTGHDGKVVYVVGRVIASSTESVGSERSSPTAFDIPTPLLDYIDKASLAAIAKLAGIEDELDLCLHLVVVID